MTVEDILEQRPDIDYGGTAANTQQQSQSTQSQPQAQAGGLGSLSLQTPSGSQVQMDTETLLVGFMVIQTLLLVYIARRV